MSKGSGTSLTRLGDASVVPLHNAIRRLFPELISGELGPPSVSARKRAFNGTPSHRWFKYNYMRSQCLKRYQEGSVTAEQREAATIAAFHTSEARCRLSNNLLYGALESSALVSPTVVGILRRVKRIMLRLFGDIEWEEVFYNLSFSQGATTEFARRDAAADHKWAKGAHVTNGSVFLLQAYLEWARLPLDHLVVPKGCDRAVFFSVVKNWSKNRGCEKQATWNVALQKALGAVMKNRLRRRAGMLTPDAQGRHSDLAKYGSAHGHLATGDLEGASDSISCALVHTALSGTRLYRGLTATRHEYVEVDGDCLLVEKFSSMGNGYTFELETALFYAVLVAVCGDDAVVSVYGDDLIYPVEFHAAVVDAFTALGFVFNSEKTFAEGDFRESCGGHFYKGRSVKPFYIENLPKTYGEVIGLHNDILQWLDGIGPLEGFLDVLRECRKLIPKRFWGPYGLPGAIWSEWDEATPRFIRSSGKVKRARWVVDPDNPSGPLIQGGVEWVLGPAYQRWEVKVVRYSVPSQVHDYYIGSLLLGLSRFNAPRADDHRTRPGSKWARPTADDARLVGPDTQLAEFMFPSYKAERIGRAPVGVQHHWRRLPVRV